VENNIAVAGTRQKKRKRAAVKLIGLNNKKGQMATTVLPSNREPRPSGIGGQSPAGTFKVEKSWTRLPGYECQQSSGATCRYYLSLRLERGVDQAGHAN